MIRKVKVVDANTQYNQIEELKQLAANYPAGSLERKAVEEEIEKLNDPPSPRLRRTSKFPMTNDK